MRSGSHSKNGSAKPRPRGRPVKSEADQAEIRNKILDATAAAYGETGYHGLSVQAILEKADLSRPTFYKHFANVDEPVRLVIAQAHDGLVDRLRNQIPPDADIEEKMTRALTLYLEWGKSIGPLLRPLYIGLHDPLSPVSELRPQVLQRIGELYTKALELSGIKLKNPVLVELMITGIEFLGYRYHLEQSTGKVTLRMIKDAIVRLVACTVVEPDELLKQINSRRDKRKR